MTENSDEANNVPILMKKLQTALKKVTEAIVNAETQQEADRLRAVREEALIGFGNQISPDGAIALREEIRQFELIVMHMNLFNRFRNYQFECEKNLVKPAPEKIAELERQVDGFAMKVKDEGPWASELRSNLSNLSKLLEEFKFWYSVDGLPPAQQTLVNAVALGARVAGKFSRIFKK